MFWDGKSKGTWHNIIDMQRLGKVTLIVEKRQRRNVYEDKRSDRE